MNTTVLVIPTDGNGQDMLLEAIVRWTKFYEGQLNKVVLVGAIDKLKGALATSGALTRVETPQHQRRPRLNQQRALATVLTDAPADVTVIWTHDDIFLTKPVDLTVLTHLTKCAKRPEAHPKKTHSSYALATQSTMVNLRKRGFPDHDYELHLPLVIEDIDQWNELLPMDDNMQFRSWVMNHLQDEPADIIDDAKVFRTTDRIQTHGIFSTAKNLPYQSFL